MMEHLLVTFRPVPCSVGEPGMQPIRLPEELEYSYNRMITSSSKCTITKETIPKEQQTNLDILFRTTDQVEHVAQMFPFGFQDFTIPVEMLHIPRQHH